MEQRGFVCDAGCGSTLVLTAPHHSVSRGGWWTAYPPEGQGRAIHACSTRCLLTALGYWEQGIQQIPEQTGASHG